MATKTMAYLTLITLLITAVAATSYTNHTIGGSAANTTSTNYSTWAANQTFNLEDYLIFNVNTIQMVIQTYNETTFRSYNIGDLSNDDTFQYRGGSNQFDQMFIIPVPLIIEENYYLSNFEFDFDYDSDYDSDVDD